MTKAKNVLPQDKGGESEAVEKTTETSPNGAEKNSQNDAAGTQDADAGPTAPAADDGKGGDDDASAEAHRNELFSDMQIEAIEAIALMAVSLRLPQMLAEVEARRQADAEQAAKERHDAELAEQRKAEQEQRNRDRRQQREEQKAREKAAEARAAELEQSASFYQHVRDSGIEHGDIVAACQNAPRFLVMFANGNRFNIDVTHTALATSIKAQGDMLFLTDRIDVPVDVETDELTECWLIPTTGDRSHVRCGLRCELGGKIAIGGGRPVTFPAESIAWRC